MMSHSTWLTRCSNGSKIGLTDQIKNGALILGETYDPVREWDTYYTLRGPVND